MARSAVIKKRNYKATRTASFFHPIMKNERLKPNTPTETRTIPARTQSNQTPRRSGDEQFAPDTSCLYLCQPRQPTFPRRKATIKSTSAMWYSALQKTNTNDISQTQLPYTPPRGVNKIYKCDAVFPIGEARTETISQTQLPYNAPQSPRKKRKKTAICARCINFRANYWQVGGVEIPLLLLQSYVDSCII